MNTNTTLGQQGEKTAETYLLAQGYTLLHRNYRYKRAEVDLVMQKDRFLVLIEVKTRSSRQYGNPEEAVSGRKQEMLFLAAEELIQELDWQHEVRFDVVSIFWHHSHPEVLHIEDAFH
ncbi:endonuclease [Rufibacter sp. DG15C]|uniref:YraN family protein n=1 Tax=Rufibacter sp. DG15C TaxID=1379909 RepID=UPI00078EF200|nr:YraN family protein [Rufibacter sp. DG15C]AMM50653.1 endonuclease [Rufibacter sp. DG15C]